MPVEPQREDKPPRQGRGACGKMVGGDQHLLPRSGAVDKALSGAKPEARHLKAGQRPERAERAQRAVAAVPRQDKVPWPERRDGQKAAAGGDAHRCGKAAGPGPLTAAVPKCDVTDRPSHARFPASLRARLHQMRENTVNADARRIRSPKGLPSGSAPAIAVPMAKQLDYLTMKEIFRRFHEAEAEPKGELEHVNAFTLVVAVALSAQATDAGVNKATRSLFQVADTPEKMLALGEEGLTEHIKTIGLYRQKAKNVIKLSRILVEEYGGEVPSSRAALQSLPGVGRKTANVVLNMWFHQPAQAVDTHIFRVGNRSGIAPGKDVETVERAIEDNVPAEYQQHAHHWLILHGRYICVARKPKCGACLIRDLCSYEEKTL